MKHLSATIAALTTAALAVVVALPTAASTASTGGSAPTLSDGGQAGSTQQARTASYRPARATWYGPGFWGHRTACGATLTHSTLGVAHKKLPCGTKVALRFRGRSVVVRVIDRGPYAKGVDYDLTQATAKRLGMAATSSVGAAPLGR